MRKEELWYTGNANDQYLRNRDTKHGVRFILITLLWTWGILSVPAIMSLNFEHNLTRIAYLLAGASPSLLALLFVFSSEDRYYIRSFIQRTISFRSIRSKGWLYIIFFMPAVIAAAAAFNYLLFDVPPDCEVLKNYLNDPEELLFFAGFTFIFGPLAEEIGWRGYLMDCFFKSGIMVYGAVIGCVWSLWHLPMFFITGTYQSTLLAQGMLPVVSFFLATIAMGVILGSLVVQNNGSILAAILMHFTINFFGEVISIGLWGEVFKTGILVMVALIMIVVSYNRESYISFTHGLW